VSSSYLLFKDHDNLEISEDFSGKSLNVVKSLHKWEIIEKRKNETEESSNLKFSHILNFSFPQEIDVLIALQCDEEWGVFNENSTPRSPPQSHLVLARTKENYTAENNGFYIKNEKTVYQYLKKINIDGGEQKKSQMNPYKRHSDYYYQAKFHKCFFVGSKTDFEDHNFLIFSSDYAEENIKINGKVQYFNNSFKSFLFENGDISYCDSFHLGKNVNIFNSISGSSIINLLNYENSTTSFFEINNSNQSLSISIETEKSLSSLYLSEMLGRSILLYNEELQGEFLIGQINILQNYQCQEEARSCLGENLEDDDGICLLMNEFKFRERENFLIKIAIRSNQANETLETRIVADVKLLNELYENIEKIIIINEDSKTEFQIVNDNITSNIFASEMKNFSLNPKYALSNKIMIMGEGNNKTFKIGLCDVALLDNQDLYFEVEENILNSEIHSNNYWMGILPFVLVCLTLFVVLCIHYKQGPLNNFVLKFDF